MIEVLKDLEQTLSTPIGHDKASQVQDLLCGLVQVILIRVGPMI
jgi:hypothetical protein